MSDKSVRDQSASDTGLVGSTLDAEQQSRRDFLFGLGRWSKIAIGAAILGPLAAGQSDAQAGAWINNRGGYGGGWINGGGGGWVNGRGGGGGWINGHGGGGGWINRR